LALVVSLALAGAVAIAMLPAHQAEASPAAPPLILVPEVDS
jgi:hypothetical protein